MVQRFSTEAGNPSLGRTIQSILFGGSQKRNISFLAISLALYFVSLPLEFVPLTNGASVSKYVAVLPLLAAALNIKRFRFRRGGYVVVLVLLLSLALTSKALFSMNPSISNESALITNLVFVIVLSGFDFSEEDLSFVIRSMVFSSWLALVFMLLFSVDLLGTGRMSISVADTTQDPNYFCGYFMFGMSAGMCKFLKDNKLTSLCAVAVFFAAALSTGSRGGLAALLIAAMIVVAFHFRKEKRKLRIVGIFLLVLLLMVVVFQVVMSQLPETVSERFTIDYLVQHGDTHRSAIQDSLMSSFGSFSLSEKLFGVGLGLTRLFNPYGNVAHNVWFEMLIGFGIAGVLLQAVLYLLLLKDSIKTLESEWVLGSLSGFFVLGLSMSVVYYKPIWAFVLVAILLVRNPRVGKRAVD